MWWEWRSTRDNGYQILWRGASCIGPMLTAPCPDAAAALTVWRGFPFFRWPSRHDVAGRLALTLPARPDIFFTMRPALFTLLLSGLLACASRNGSELDERLLARVVVDVIRLHHRYAEQPDSLAVKRKALLQGVRFTEKDLERLAAAWKTDPETLELLAGALMESLKADSVFVRWKKSGKRNWKKTGKRSAPGRRASKKKN